MLDSYVFPAIFDYAEDGISISFPDLPGCYSEGDNNSEAMFMARDALSGRLFILEREGIPIPHPSDILTVQHEANQAVVLVDVNMKAYRARQREVKNINKMCTVPEWLAHEADEAGLNFSKTLQEGLMAKLGIKQVIRKRSR